MAVGRSQKQLDILVRSLLESLCQPIRGPTRLDHHPLNPQPLRGLQATNVEPPNGVIAKVGRQKPDSWRSSRSGRPALATLGQVLSLHDSAALHHFARVAAGVGRKEEGRHQRSVASSRSSRRRHPEYPQTPRLPVVNICRRVIDYRQHAGRQQPIDRRGVLRRQLLQQLGRFFGHSQVEAQVARFCRAGTECGSCCSARS